MRRQFEAQALSTRKITSIAMRDARVCVCVCVCVCEVEKIISQYSQILLEQKNLPSLVS